MNVKISTPPVNRSARILNLVLNVHVKLDTTLLMTEDHVKILMSVRCMESVVKVVSIQKGVTNVPVSKGIT